MDEQQTQLDSQTQLNALIAAIAMTAESGDKQLRGQSAEQKFAQTPMRDDCADAANRTQRRHPDFPGWQIYSRIVRGDSCFDRTLAAYAIGLARAFSRARKRNGRAVIARRLRRNDYIAQCGIDALEFVIAGRYSETARARALSFSIDNKVYQKVRGNLADCMLEWYLDFKADVEYELSLVERENRKYIFGKYP